MKKLTLGQVSTLASKLRVVYGNVVFAEDLKLPDYGLSIQEACLFALIVDDYKNGNYFMPELVVGRFDYSVMTQVHIDLSSLERKRLIFCAKSGGWFPAWALPKDIFELKQKNANVIKAIDYLLMHEKNLCSENRLLNILDFIMDYCSADFCTGCKNLSEDGCECINKGNFFDCRNNLLEQSAKGTLFKVVPCLWTNIGIKAVRNEK